MVPSVLLLGHDAEHSVFSQGFLHVGHDRQDRFVLLHFLLAGEYHSAQRRGDTRSLWFERGAARSWQRRSRRISSWCLQRSDHVSFWCSTTWTLRCHVVCNTWDVDDVMSFELDG